MKFSALDVWGFIWRRAGAAAVQIDLRLDGHPNPVGWIQLKSNKNHALIQSNPNQPLKNPNPSNLIQFQNNLLTMTSVVNAH